MYLKLMVLLHFSKFSNTVYICIMLYEILVLYRSIIGDLLQTVQSQINRQEIIDYPLEHCHEMKASELKEQ